MDAAEFKERLILGKYMPREMVDARIRSINVVMAQTDRTFEEAKYYCLNKTPSDVLQSLTEDMKNTREYMESQWSKWVNKQSRTRHGVSRCTRSSRMNEEIL